MSKPTVSAKICEPYVVGGNVRRHHKLVIGPSAYETGGVLILASDISDTWFLPPIQSVISQTLDRIAHFITVNDVDAAEADKAKRVLMFITDLAGTEIANGVDLDAFKFVVTFDMIG